MDYTILNEEVTLDPLGLAYADLADDAVAAALNAVSRAAYRPLASTELLAWAGAAGRYARLKRAAASQDDTLASIAAAAVALLERDGAALDLNLPDRAAMLDALVEAEALTADDRASLYALAARPLSRAQQLGLPRITPGDIAKISELPPIQWTVS